MYGHIYWESEGNNWVTFHIDTSYTRNIETGFFADGQAVLGTRVRLNDVGVGTTAFYFGDGKVHSELNMVVTAYSVSENWVFGTVTIRHQYSAPSNQGMPWLATLSGCCRFTELAIQGDSNFVIKTEVNLADALHSPRARMIPMITSYMQPNSAAAATAMQLSSIFVNADDPKGTESIQWSIELPWNVGQAAYLSSPSNSFASVSLSALASPNGQCTTEKCSCPDVIAGQETGFGIGPQCLVDLLRTDKRLQMNKFTVEGWVKARAPGYVLTTGPDQCFWDPADRTRKCGGGTRLSSCGSPQSNFPTCDVSTLSVAPRAFPLRTP